jgi:hypothetical protein
MNVNDLNELFSLITEGNRMGLEEEDRLANI